MVTEIPTVSRVRTAERLLAEQKLDGIVPVPLEAVAKNLGYDAVVFDPQLTVELEEVAGMVNHEKKTIYVNGRDNVYRQRFTLAHEIGHVVLHAEKSVVDFRKNIDQPSTPTEVEANNFAADLLMPRAAFIRAWLASGGSCEYLSKQFGASTDAVRIRARSLRLDRA